MSMQLRWYQQEAVDACFEYLSREIGNPLLEVPTGAGKSLINAAIVRRAVEEHQARVICVTHRAELIKQNVAELYRYWPQAMMKTGIWSAALNKKEKTQDIVFCGVQTAFRKSKELGYRDIVLVDECHLINTEDGTQYDKFFEGLAFHNNNFVIVGQSATPCRMGQGLLTVGENAWFDSIVYKIDIKRLVDEGHLVPLISGATSADVNTNDLRVSAGEFASKDLECAFNVAEVNSKVAEDIRQHMNNGRKSCIVFCTSIEHINAMVKAIQDLGDFKLRVASIDGSDTKYKRDKVIEDFTAGYLNILVSCDVLTTGFNVPHIDLIAYVRATISPILHVQILGRGTRKAAGKENCMILDYGGNIARHGPIDNVKMPKAPRASKNKNEAPMKLCPNCDSELHFAVRVCKHCDFEFPPMETERKANMHASQLPAYSGKGKQKPDKIISTYEIDSTMAFVHRKKDSSTVTCRIDYYWGMKKKASEWLCFNHAAGTFPRKKASEWWRDNVGTYEPTDVDEAVKRLNTNEFPVVFQITVDETDEFARVIEIQQHAPNDDAGNDSEDELGFITNYIDNENAIQELKEKTDPFDWTEDDIPF